MNYMIRDLIIQGASDDTSRFYRTSIEICNMNDVRREVRINPAMFRSGHEPTIDAIDNFIQTLLGLNRRRRRGYSIPKEFQHIIKIGESGFVIMFHKKGIRYFLNGLSSSKDILMRALSRTIYKSCFTNEGAELDKYLYKNIQMPENVSYALENRAPFHWYREGKKIECRFRVSMIDDDECAMEISDGIWCPIKVKDLNIYMEYYWKGNKRGSWKHLSPTRLWKKLLGDYPTDSQEKLMLAFLEQNRTQSIVEARARELMKELSELHSEKIKIIKHTKEDNTQNTYMFVRGQIGDWVITDDRYKTEIQMVSTYLFNKGEDKDSLFRTKFGDGYISNAICIDNMTRHSSIGDQFCARALALMNDTITIQLVNTIKRYITQGHTEGQEDNRLDFTKLEEYVKEFEKR